MRFDVDKIQAAKAMLDANGIDSEPRTWVLTRPEARILFGAKATDGLPDKQLGQLCGEKVYLVGEKWPDLPLK